MLRFARAIVHLSLLSVPCIFLNAVDPKKTKQLHCYHQLFLLGGYQLQNKNRSNMKIARNGLTKKENIFNNNLNKFDLE